MRGWLSLRWRSDPAATGTLDEKAMAAICSIPVRLEVEWRVSEVQGLAGVRLALRAELVLSAVEVCVSMRAPGSGAERAPADDVRNNVRDNVRKVGLFPLGMRVPRNEQRVFAPIPRGHGYLRAIDDRGRPLSGNCELGPCGATRRTDMSFRTEVDVRAWVAPRISAVPGRHEFIVRGELTFVRGVSLALKARPDNGGGTAVIVVGPGTTLQAHERRLEGDGAAEAWVFAGFVDEW